MKLRFDPVAVDELVSAVEYYEAKVPELGSTFAIAVEKALDSIRNFPVSGATWKLGCRRKLIPGFPYYIVYRVVDERIHIVAALHGRRSGESWQDRL